MPFIGFLIVVALVLVPAWFFWLVAIGFLAWAFYFASSNFGVKTGYEIVSGFVLLAAMLFLVRYGIHHIQWK